MYINTSPKLASAGLGKSNKCVCRRLFLEVGLNQQQKIDHVVLDVVGVVRGLLPRYIAN